MAKKGGLGKGLEALFADNATGEASGVVTLPLAQIEPNRDQPRKYFDPDALAELAESIREHGVIQPLIVRPMPGGSYQIVAGERRWRASRLAGLNELPVLIREMDDTAVMEVALIENLQREDLNIVEEAQGYQALMDTFGLTQAEAARRVGKSRPAVANAIRILSLPGEVLEQVKAGKLSSGHAKALLAFREPEEQLAAARQTLKEGLTVRQVESLARRAARPQKEPAPQKAAWGEESYYRQMELALAEALSRKVKIAPAGEGGTLSLEFYSKEDLSRLAEALSRRS